MSYWLPASVKSDFQTTSNGLILWGNWIKKIIQGDVLQRWKLIISSGIDFSFLQPNKNIFIRILLISSLSFI